MQETPPTDPYSDLRRRLQKKLNGFSDDALESEGIKMVSYRPERTVFPVPELVLFALRDVLGWKWYGAGEKVRWTVRGALDGAPVAFELRKFGFTVIRPEGRDDLDPRILGQLPSALREVETFLRPLAEQQVANGQVLITNRYSEFNDRYHFFRDHAERSYRRSERPTRRKEKAVADDSGRVSLSDATRDMNRMLSAQREGFFYSTAMVDSYFSCLEHRLILLRAFTGRPLAEGELLELLASKWDEKLKTLFPSPLPESVATVLGQMRRIKERIRNPFAHGGVENDRGSLFFRLPKIGAIPANFSKFANSVRFSFLPVEADDHAECCAVFDALDALLSERELSGPHEMVRWGVDPVFDAESLSEYAEAVAGGPEHVDAFIEHWSRAWERHANMDY